MEQLHLIFLGVGLIASSYIVVYTSLYLRTSRNSRPLVGTHIHPIIKRFIALAIFFAAVSVFLCLVFLVREAIMLYLEFS